MAFTQQLVKGLSNPGFYLRRQWHRHNWESISRRGGEVQVRTIQGKFIISTKDQFISKYMYCELNYDLHSMERAINFLRSEKLLLPAPETMVLDVGANIGPICIGMVERGMVGRAIAIEAEPYNFDLLRRNVALNSLQAKIACVGCAASSEDGFAKMALNSAFSLDVRENLGDHRIVGVASTKEEAVEDGYLMVPMRRLDDIVLEHNDGRIPGPRECLTWMDIQAHETFALQGAPKLLAHGNPTYVEVWPLGLEKHGGGIALFVDVVREYWTHFVRFEDGVAETRTLDHLPTFIAGIDNTADETYFKDILLVRK